MHSLLSFDIIIIIIIDQCLISFCNNIFTFLGKGGKNRRRGKNENETEKRELVFKEDGQGKLLNI